MSDEKVHMSEYVNDEQIKDACCKMMLFFSRENITLGTAYLSVCMLKGFLEEHHEFSMSEAVPPHEFN